MHKNPTVSKLVLAVIQVYEGWGQTETSALSTFNLPGEWLSGHVGVPIQCNSISLGDLPEQGYYARERKGEILVKGDADNK